MRAYFLHVVATALVVAALARATPAHAAPIAQRTLVQLQLGVVSHTRLRAEIENATPHASPRERDGTETNPFPRLGLGLAHAWSEHGMLHLFAGGSVGGERRHASVLGFASSRASLELAPSIRYVAGRPEHRVRFFAGGGAGYMGEILGQQGGDSATTKALSISGSVGALGFFSHRASLDPALEVTYFRGRGDIESENAGTTLDVSWSAWRVMLTVSLSGWFGGGK